MGGLRKHLPKGQQTGATGASTQPATVADSMAAEREGLQAQAGSCPDTHSVQKGEFMIGLARDQVGDGRRYGEMAKLNPQVEDPNLIYPGDQLKVPETWQEACEIERHNQAESLGHGGVPELTEQMAIDSFNQDEALRMAEQAPPQAEVEVPPAAAPEAPARARPTSKPTVMGADYYPAPATDPRAAEKRQGRSGAAAGAAKGAHAIAKVGLAVGTGGNPAVPLLKPVLDTQKYIEETAEYSQRNQHGLTIQQNHDHMKATGTPRDTRGDKLSACMNDPSNSKKGNEKFQHCFKKAGY